MQAATKAQSKARQLGLIAKEIEMTITPRQREFLISAASDLFLSDGPEVAAAFLIDELTQAKLMPVVTPDIRPASGGIQIDVDGDVVSRTGFKAVPDWTYGGNVESLM